VVDSYDALAAAYDTLTADYDYERWLRAIDELSARHGSGGRRVLDVACGTGKSFLPLIGRGYSVTGVDVSPRMLREAARKTPDVPLHLLDMRELPELGRFDLVTCLDDALNNLVTEEALVAALRGFRRNLAEGGVAVWDVNTLAAYRRAFCESHLVEGDGIFLAWEGRATTIDAGETAEATIHIFARDAGGAWRRTASSHRHRHWPAARIAAAAREAGLEIVARLGQRPGVELDPECDEAHHTKALYVARRPPAWEGGDGMDLFRP
jgi:SAM-dependent methyltransferase